MRRLLPLVAGLAVSAGCATRQPTNPSFALSVDQARQELRQMQQHPGEPERPVLVLAGFLDPGLAVGHLTESLIRATGDDRFISINFVGCNTFDACRTRVLERIEQTYASTDPQWTTEVDVVAVSMGGLAARHAAAPARQSAKPSRRLRIARLFTISTPHRGARQATLPTWDQCQIDMRPGSRFLQRLDAASRDAPYQLYAYGRLGDELVGTANTAPAGATPWWVPNRPFEGAHLGAFGDPRFIADIARRLRGEKPYTTAPPAPLPAQDAADD